MLVIFYVMYIPQHAIFMLDPRCTYHLKVKLNSI